MNELSKLAEAASQQNSNYLPILLLFLCIAGGGWLFRWLVGRLEKQTTLLEGLFREANDGRADAIRVMSEHAECTRELKNHLRDNTEFLRSAKSVLERI